MLLERHFNALKLFSYFVHQHTNQNSHPEPINWLRSFS